MSAVGTDGEKAVDFPQRRICEGPAIGQQDCGRVVAVLGLPQQVSSADFRIDRAVGDDDGLGRASEQIYADRDHCGKGGSGDHHKARRS